MTQGKGQNQVKKAAFFKRVASCKSGDRGSPGSGEQRQ